MQTTPRGLATLALLKTRFEEKRDHIDLLVPFVLDALANCESEFFLPEEICTLMKQRSLSIPIDTARLVLRRLVLHQGLLKEAGGCFWRNTRTPIPDPQLEEKCVAIRARHRELALALQSFAKQSGVQLATSEKALSALADFIADYKAPLLLQEPVPDSPLERTARSKRKLIRTIARFISEQCLTSEQLRSSLEELVDGMVLQDTLMLRDVSSVGPWFRGLQVALDTPVLFAAIHLYGAASSVATNEGLTLLREAGAVTFAFKQTVSEMRRILKPYESRLGTVQGQLDLRRSSPLTEHCLSNRLGPSDIYIISETLEKRLEVQGVSVREMPERNVRFTLNEGALAEALVDRYHDRYQQRILHDVACVVGVHTLRAGRHVSSMIETSGAVFCTTSGQVIHNIQECYAQEEDGAPPIVHQFALSSLAWFKKPAAARGVKLHELADVCAAVLRPTPETYQKFTDTLRNLWKSKVYLDNATVAILSSRLVGELLAKIDEDMEPDADTMTQTIERILQLETEAAVRQAQATLFE
ncbi:MAG: hypothetical protein ACREYE_11705 [Gammaproteobacteria bacterium]